MKSYELLMKTKIDLLFFDFPTLGILISLFWIFYSISFTNKSSIILINQYFFIFVVLVFR